MRRDAIRDGIGRDEGRDGVDAIRGGVGYVLCCRLLFMRLSLIPSLSIYIYHYSLLALRSFISHYSYQFLSSLNSFNPFKDFARPPPACSPSSADLK